MDNVLGPGLWAKKQFIIILMFFFLRTGIPVLSVAELSSLLDVPLLLRPTGVLASGAT